MRTLFIFTDGACKGNGTKNAKGGIGVYFNNLDNMFVSEILDNSKYVATNQRAELTAMIKALETIIANVDLINEIFDDIIIYTDSTYVERTCNVWRLTWKKNNWKNTKKVQVSNCDLIQHLDELLTNIDVKLSIIHIRGHGKTNDEFLKKGNEIADEYATKIIA
jgi:ribonuclease HI